MKRSGRMRRLGGIGGLTFLLVIALAAMAVGYALWSKTITIRSTVETGRVHAEIVDAFTDDDNVVNNANLDSQDTGDCPHAGLPDPNNPDRLTSCDPAETGPDPKPHYDKDVAECFAAVDENDSNIANIQKLNVYPSYHCTAWLAIHNDGTIPVKIAQAVASWTCPDGTVQDLTLVPSNAEPADLDCDGAPDITVHLTGIDLCQQIEPSETFFMDVDQHILQEAPQGAELNYQVEVLLAQWNEANLFGCPVFDQIIDADGIGTAGDGLGTCGSPVTPGAVQVAVGDALTTWPAADPDNHGIDILEAVVDSAWTSTCNGDDIHIEGVSPVCTGDRDAEYDDGSEGFGTDCVVLDYDGSLVQDQPVACDLETGTFCTGSLLTDLVFHDANGDGAWDNGEDIVIDGNGNGIFD